MPSGFTPDGIWVSDLNVRKVDSDPGSTVAIRNTTAGLSRVKSELDTLIDQGLEATSVRTSSASPITALVGELVRLNANGAITVNAPAPASLAEGEVFGIQVVTGDPGANNITVARNGHSTINEVAASLVLDTKGTFIFRRAGTDLVVESSAPLMLAVDDAGAADGYVLSRVAGAPAWVSPTGGGNVSKVGTPVNDQIGVWTGDGTIEGDADLTFNGAGALYVQSTDAGTAIGPTLTLHRNSATPAAFDLIGGLKFDGEDSGGTQTTYAQIAADIISPTDTAEKGRLNFYTQDALGTLWLNVQMQIDQVSFLDCDIDLYDHQGAPANGTYLDYLYFSSENSGAEYVRYVTLQAQTDNVTPDQEDGSFQVAVMKDGTSTVTLEVDSAGVAVAAGALTLATDLAVTEGGTGASTAAAARTNLGVDVASISGHIETAANKTYILDLKAPYAYVVNSLAARTASGTCTAALAIDGVNVTGISALSVTSTEASATASAANTVAVDTTLALVVSANSTALDLSFTVKITR